MDENDPRIDIARRNLRIAAAMREMNLSEVSRQAGMSRNGLGQFLSGRTTLSYGNMLRVCDVLRIPLALVHRPESLTEARIRLYRILEKMPDHLAGKALEGAVAEVGQS